MAAPQREGLARRGAPPKPTVGHVLGDGESLSGVQGDGPVDGFRRPHDDLFRGLDPGRLGR